ncbi:MAG: hypothetical protein SWK90_11765 [Chloroflexota bacterium]|nr:hypothetical protein [Chloroflexota bacterium]
MRKKLILIGLLLEGMVILMVGLSVSICAAAPMAGRSPAVGGMPSLATSSAITMTRIQTVTLHEPPGFHIYATDLTTTIQFKITDYPLGSGTWIMLPTDAVTHEVTCQGNPTCQISYSVPDTIYFLGTGEAVIYVDYSTASRARRIAGSRVISLTYGVGNPDIQFGLTNTIYYSRTFDRGLVPWLIEPSGYEQQLDALRWVTNVQRVRFTAAFTEPLLGSDLVIDHLDMGPDYPEVGQTVRYTAVVRNRGDYGTGRAVLAELFVRPYALGPPVVLTDHVGGWTWIDEDGRERGYAEDALFKWYAPAPYQVYLPLVIRTHQAGSGGDTASTHALLPGSYWWPGLEPGEVITGVTSFPWPDECGTQVCGVWAKVDPSYLDVGVVYEWWGYNPEGLDCGLEDGLPTCEEESNNVAAAFTRFLTYIPVVLRDQ